MCVMRHGVSPMGARASFARRASIRDVPRQRRCAVGPRLPILGKSMNRASRATSRTVVLVPAGQELVDGVLPGVRLIAGILLGLDMLGLECLIGPPPLALAVKLHRFGKKLIAVPRERIGVDDADLDGPEPAPAGFIAQIRRLVRCADEDALARLDDLFSAVARAVSFLGAGDECFQRRGLGLVQRG